VTIEHIPDDAPCEVVERCGGRYLVRPAEDERKGDVFDRCAREHAREYVDEYWSEDAGEPEPLQVCVETSDGEDALRANQSPDYGCVEKDAAIGAVELVGLVFGADVLDGATESPF